MNRKEQLHEENLHFKGLVAECPGTNGWVNVDLPNDYSVTLPRDPNASGGASNGFFPGGKGTYVKK